MTTFLIGGIIAAILLAKNKSVNGVGTVSGKKFKSIEQACTYILENGITECKVRYTSYNANNPHYYTTNLRKTIWGRNPQELVSNIYYFENRVIDNSYYNITDTCNHITSITIL